jgi:hypothetical protein
LLVTSSINLCGYSIKDARSGVRLYHGSLCLLPVIGSQWKRNSYRKMSVPTVACGKQAMDVSVSLGWNAHLVVFGIFFFCTSETSREEAGEEGAVLDLLQHGGIMFLQWRVL